MNQALDTLITLRGAIKRRQHRELATATALTLADPTAIVTGRCAASLMGWTPTEPSVLTAASRLPSRPGYRLSERVIPRRLVQVSGGIRLTSKALTAIDLAVDDGASAIDDALRRRIGLDDLWDAYRLTPNRRGRGSVRFLLRTSRTQPWSPAERAAHAALKAVPGWVANHHVGVDRDTDYWIDIAFRSLRLGFEIDGRAFHSAPDAVLADCRRTLKLGAAGWWIIHVPADWVMTHPEAFATAVIAIVRTRRTQLG